MNPITLDFNEKEVAVIELMAPPLSAQDVCRKVMRDWFSTNSERMYSQVKTLDAKLDEIIAVSTAQKENVDNAVVK